MANKKHLMRELANLDTIIMYRDFLSFIAENSIVFENLPENIEEDRVNKWLIERGAVACFFEDVIGEIEILPFNSDGKKDIYGRPSGITVFSDSNGYKKRLKRGQFVIIYDNTQHVSIYPHILQFAERLALNRRVEDINIFNQKTPRIFQCTSDQKLTLEKIIQSFDTFNTSVLVSDSLDFDQILTDFNPVPYVADKINENGNRVISEFLQLIGICSVRDEKKERLLSSEIYFNQGGALVSRLGRLNPRKRAFDFINKKYGTDIKVKFYDETEDTKGVFEYVESLSGGMVGASNNSENDEGTGA